MSNFIDKLRNNSVLNTILWIGSFAAAIISLYTYFNKPRAVITFDLVEKIDLMSKYAGTSRIKIFFDNENIVESGKQIQEVIIKVSNTGNKDILPSYFDSLDKLGLSIKNAISVYDIKLLATDNSYFSRTVNPEYKNNSMLLNDFIFEAGDSFLLTFNIVYKCDKKPTIEAIGRVAGASIELVDSLTKPKNINPIYQLFNSGLSVNIIRVPVFTLIGLVIFVFIIVTGIVVSDIAENISIYYRKKHFIKCMGLSYREIEEQPTVKMIYKEYIKGGRKQIESIQDYINDKSTIITDAAFAEFTETQSATNTDSLKSIITKYNLKDDDAIGFKEGFYASELYNAINKIGAIKKDGETVKIDEIFTDAIKKTLSTLNN